MSAPFPRSRTKLCDFGADGLSGRSPDRLDALVWAITALALTPKAPEPTNATRLRARLSRASSLVSCLHFARRSDVLLHSRASSARLARRARRKLRAPATCSPCTRSAMRAGRRAIHVALTREGYRAQRHRPSLRAHGRRERRHHSLARLRGREEIDDHPLLALLARPNPDRYERLLHRGALSPTCCCSATPMSKARMLDGSCANSMRCAPTA